MSLVANIERKSKAPRRQVPYALTCSCGTVCEGLRGLSPRMIACTKCGEMLFVFPVSELAERRGTGQSVKVSAIGAKHMRRLWSKPLIAAGATVAIIGVAVLFSIAPWKGNSNPDARSPDAANGRMQLEQAEHALSEGAYTTAAEQYRALLDTRNQRPGVLNPEEVPRVEHLVREALLMRDLCPDTIPEMLRSARGLSDRAWREQFANRYRGKSIVLDCNVRPDGTGDFVVDLDFPPEDGDVRLSLRGLQLFQRYSVDPPRRVIFGVRLADAQRDPRGGWTVSVIPDSGVQLTHPAIFSGTSLATDDEIVAILRQQSQ